jgi:hypothetical protein
MNHAELGPEEKSLIAAARDAQAPSEVQRARVRRGLQAKLAAGVAAPSLAASTALAMAGKIGVGVALVAAVGAGTAYFVAARPGTKASSGEVRTTTVANAPAETPVTERLGAASLDSQPAGDLRPVPARSTNHVRRRETSPRPAVDLAGELALLTEVNAAIQGGSIAQAGELLRTYDRRFPFGKLTEERAAAGILVLCAAGRTQSARSEAHRFIARWPRSPLVARIQASCAGEDKAP